MRLFSNSIQTLHWRVTAGICINMFSVHHTLPTQQSYQHHCEKSSISPQKAKQCPPPAYRANTIYDWQGIPFIWGKSTLLNSKHKSRKVIQVSRSQQFWNCPWYFKSIAALQIENGKKMEKSVNQDSTDCETCAALLFGANVKLLPLLPLTDSGRFG